VTGLVPDHLSALLAKLEEAGVPLEVTPTSVRVRGAGRPRPADIVTSPFPGFPTDMQAQMMAVCSIAGGTSVITDTVYLDRFTHVRQMSVGL
jgi:UDP-N-acetylglucosamine 1-carboxyvinyltransferase